jgi:hypothetical protein
MVKNLFFLCLLCLGSLLTLSVAGVHLGAENNLPLRFASERCSSVPEKERKPDTQCPVREAAQHVSFSCLRNKLNRTIQSASKSLFADLSGARTSYRSLQNSHYRVLRTANRSCK